MKPELRQQAELMLYLDRNQEKHACSTTTATRSAKNFVQEMNRLRRSLLGRTRRGIWFNESVYFP